MAKETSILIVDDEPKICQFLEVFLTREGFRAGSVRSAAEALATLEKDRYDLVITDLKMPGMDGFELVRRLKSLRRDLPVVMITGYATVETAVQALRHGVDDYITKPFNIEELRKVIARTLRASRVERENREMEERCIAVLKALATLLESKDKYLSGHSERVGRYACALGEAIGAGPKELELLRTAADLHDIGKIAVNERILDKPDRLTSDERDAVEDHPTLGERIVGPLHFLQPIQPLIRHHHEHMDGTGYPDRLKGGEIPRLARILAIADAFDAMTSERPYRPAMTAAEAAKEIASCAGDQFDEALAGTFCTKVISRQFK